MKTQTKADLVAQLNVLRTENSMLRAQLNAQRAEHSAPRTASVAPRTFKRPVALRTENKAEAWDRRNALSIADPSHPWCVERVGNEFFVY